jgi:hypothetical protein
MDGRANIGLRPRSTKSPPRLRIVLIGRQVSTDSDSQRPDAGFLNPTALIVTNPLPTRHPRIIRAGYRVVSSWHSTRPI